MKKIFFIIIVLSIGLFSINKLMAQKSKIRIGDKVPYFTLKDQNGTNFSIENLVHKKNMVIYFYPKDDTPGCTKEACSFRDEFEDFKDLDTVIIGISGDGVASHKEFEKKYNLPFILLADTKKEVQKLFGVPKSALGLIPGRVTYVVNKEGTVIYIFNSLRKAKEHIKKAKEALQNNIRKH